MMKYLCEIISLKRPSYIVIIFVSIFTAILLKLNIETKNVLVYEFKEVDIENNMINNDSLFRKFDCEIYNLSNEEALKNIELVIKFSTKLKPLRIVNQANITTKERATLSNKLLFYNIYNIENRYEFPIIQPSSSYILEFETITNINNISFPKIYSGNDKTIIRLIPKSIFTILKKNIRFINILALIFLILTASILLFIHYKICKNENHQYNYYFSSSSSNDY